MVQIVHLARDQQPAQGGRFILIERCSPGGQNDARPLPRRHPAQGACAVP